MEYFEAQKHKEAWGKKPCTHTFLEREYYAGAFLINYVCTSCGTEFTIPQKMEIFEGRKKRRVLSERDI